VVTVGDASRTGIVAIVGDYIALTKPRVMSLLLLTATTGIFAAERGVPSGMLILYVLLGGALASGGASALNMWFEEDLDRRMGRTKARPVALRRVTGRNAFIFGITLNIASFALLSLTTNFLAAGLAMVGTALYFGLYTVWLKRNTVHNIVIGGAAGAIPPLVGYAAVDGQLTLSAWYLFAIIFFWTPPHFWALALMIKSDYSRAGIPMLPVVHGDAQTKLQILLYSVLVVAVTVLYTVAESTLGVIYLTTSIALGVGLIYYAVRLYRGAPRGFAWSLYRYSLLYLALLFVAVMVDSAVA
jgi:protoheme IX farnesyltransferase